MYVPPAFRLSDRERLHALIRQYPFALLVTCTEHGPLMTPTPLLLDETEGTLGTLYGHLARPNPQTAQIADGLQGTAWFQGPHGYVSPRWYVDRTRNVPTWNYVAVEVSGRLSALPRDAGGRFVDRLAQLYETSADGWRMAEMPPDMRDALTHGLVAFAMTIERIEGKLKLSQNKTPSDRDGVIAGLDAAGDPDSLALAAAMRGI